MPMTIDAITLDAGTDIAGLHRILAWMSPSYPVGAFTYSHGLEWAVENGQVHDMETLVQFVDAVIARGGGWVDAVLFSHAWRAAEDPAALDDIAELAAAFRASAETFQESCQQGQAFLAVTRRSWPHPILDAFAERQAAHPVAYAVAVAVACAAFEVPLLFGLNAFLHGNAANLVSAGVRLVPLGQTDGQIATARLARSVHAVAVKAAGTPLDHLGTSAPELELCSLHHETQYTRLFRS